MNMSRLRTPPSKEMHVTCGATQERSQIDGLHRRTAPTAAPRVLGRGSLIEKAPTVLPRRPAHSRDARVLRGRIGSRRLWRGPRRWAGCSKPECSKTGPEGSNGGVRELRIPVSHARSWARVEPPQLARPPGSRV